MLILERVIVKRFINRTNEVLLKKVIKYTLRTLAIKRQKERMRGIRKRLAPFYSVVSFKICLIF